MFGAIRWRLVGWSLAVLALILLFAGTAVYVILAHRLVADVDGELGGLGGLVAERLVERPDGDYQFRREGYVGGHFFLIVAPNGDILANPQHVALDAIPPDLV